MAEFVIIDAELDPTDLAQAAYDFIRTRWPDFEPADANLETWITESHARMDSEVADLLASVSQEIFKAYGQTVVNVPPNLALAATTTTTWTMIDASGYTIPAGTLMGFDADDGSTVAFETLNDVVVDPGDTVTATGEVIVRAVVAGTDGNGLDNNPHLIDSLSFVESIAAVAETSGGIDEESDEDYANRLAGELQILSPTPILPGDFAVLAAAFEGVDRAIAVDGWKVSDDTTNNERYIGVVAIDAAGEDVASGIKTAIGTSLDSQREVNFVVNMGAPTYHLIDVTTSVKCFAGFDPTQVQADVLATLTGFLDPANWGRPPFLANTAWVNKTSVKFLDVASVIKSVTGVNYIETLTIAAHGSGLGSADVAMTGVVPLTRPGTLNVTADA